MLWYTAGSRPPASPPVDTGAGVLSSSHPGTAFFPALSAFSFRVESGLAVISSYISIFFLHQSNIELLTRREPMPLSTLEVIQCTVVMHVCKNIG